MAPWYSPLMSIETARLESRRDPSSSKNSARAALLRPGRHRTIAPVRWSATKVSYRADGRFSLAPSAPAIAVASEEQ